MFTDADRLAMIQSLGGLLVRAPKGSFWATFDEDDVEVFGDPSVRVRRPLLPDCRTSDIERLGLIKDDPVEVGNESYRVKDVLRETDGWSRVLLKR